MINAVKMTDEEREDFLRRSAVLTQQLQRERAIEHNLTLYRIDDGQIVPISAREYFST